MRFNRLFTNQTLVISTSLLFSACIMTNDPQYKLSYVDTRYDQIVHTETKQLTSVDLDEAYLLSSVYVGKKRLKEARNLLKIVFDQQKTLSSGLAYIDVLNQLGDKKEAENIHKVLAILYKDNEIQDQTKIFNNF